MKSVLSYCGLILALFFSVSLQASNIITGENVRLTENQDGNIYVAGGDVKINARIAGDLVLAGGDIILSDSLLEDGLIAGGDIELAGFCGDDLRVAGGEVSIKEDIMGDLLVAGGEVSIHEGATIHGDLICAGGEVTIRGAVKGNVKTYGGSVNIQGPVSGSLDVKAGRIELSAAVTGISSIAARDITLGPDASFASDVRYWQGEGSVDFSPYLTNGAKAIEDESLNSKFMDFDKEDWKQSYRKGVFFLNIFRLVSGLLLTLLMTLFFGRFFERNTGLLSEQTNKAALYGVLTFIGLPIFTLIAAGTVVGIPLALVSGSLFVIAVVIATALAAVVIAFELRERYGKDWGKSMLLLVAGGVFIGLRLLGMIPFLGSLLLSVASVLAIGYLVLTLQQKRQSEKAEELV